VRSGYTRFDHTADVGIRIFGENFADLLIQAARGMATLMADLRTVRPRHRVAVRVDGTGHEELLVRWLQELLFLHESQDLLFRTFGIDKTAGACGPVEGWAAGEPLDLERHVTHAEIKSVTYHQLAVHQTASGWRTAIIFDV